MAGLENHPNVFSFEGRMWVSELPREEMRRQLVEQRAWDAATARQQRWWVAIGIGAALGIAAVLTLGIFTGVDPTAYLLVLPLGFGIGAVLGALVNKRLVGDSVSSTPRPVLSPVTKVPASVSRNARSDASARELIEWSKRGFVS